MSGDLSETFAADTPVVSGAGYVPRVGAAVVDFVVRLAIILAASALGAIGYAAGTAAGEVTVNVGGVIGVVAALLYAPLMIARTGGQTVGHRASSTRIVGRDGTALTAGRAGLREIVVKGLLFEGAAVLLAFLPTIVNYLWPLWDEHDEALHDKICGTRVVQA